MRNNGSTADRRPVVGVIFGSRSTEHDVSIITALGAVIKPLELSAEFQVVPIYIAKDGRWYCDTDLKDIELFTSGRIDDWLAKHESVALSFDGGLKLSSGSPSRSSAYREGYIDIAFPALHGTHGEDGEVMGVLELAGIPYVGCNLSASAIAMDKVLTKLVAKASGVAVTEFEHFSKPAYEADTDLYITNINRRLHYPLFVKPAHLGSSIGITRVTDPADLRNAIEVALHYDTKALVEEGVSNLIEVTLPIIGNQTARPALLERPMLKSEDFFDFETKYMQGGKKGGAKSGNSGKNGGVKGAQGYSELPAKLSKSLYAKAEATGLAVYQALGCSGLARVDMLINSKTGVVYCNEVNPLPGDLYGHNWSQAGLSKVDLVVELVRLAVERHAQQAAVETIFTTNYLKQF